MIRSEGTIDDELELLFRAGVPRRAVRLTVREFVVTRIETGPLGPREVTEAIEGTLRAACRLVRELGAPEDLVETVCQAALEAVRGHGGQSSRWMPQASSAAADVLSQMAQDWPDELNWPWLASRVRRSSI